MMMPFLLSISLFASIVVSSPTMPWLFDQNRHHAQILRHNKTGWEDPRKGGGRMLDYATRCNLGEPLNVVISGDSDPLLLDLEGLKLYSYSLGYAEECFGFHVGRLHQANLGDGQGLKNEQYLARQTYFPIFGTCWQTIVGGQHFRAWQQNTTKAWFIASSQEMDSGRNHKIVPNGYNRGRDWLVQRAIAGTSWQGKYWAAEVDWKEGLLDPGHRNINHNISQDGVTAILTVYRI